MISRDAERQELERAIELLGRTTRPGRLLSYVGAKYLEGQEEQLTEFTIATEVFGRSPKTFDAAQDAVVRVEAHRLRKKLREIYEKSGNSGLQISLPAGSYVPKFSLASEPQVGPLSTSDAAGPKAASGSSVSTEADQAVAVRSTRKWGRYVASILLVIAAVSLGFVMLSKPPHTSSRSQAAASAPSASPRADLSAEIHVLAGYSGSDVIDSSGVRWTPDRFFVGGGPWPRDGGFVRASSRPFLFANWRSGEFGYDIPLQPGSYELRLFFISQFRAGDEKLASFDVLLNGQPLLMNFDVNISANGPDTADEKVFRDVAPDKDGFLHLRFSNEVATPSLNGLEVTPGLAGKLQPIRIITQPTSFVDHNGQRWRADDYYINGFRSTEHRKVNGTDDPELFGAERYGHFSYAIPVDTRGRYTVVLHFAEFYFGPQSLGGGGVGSRVFHVFCNGQTLLQDFDVYKEGGSLRHVSKTFSNIKPSAQGKINLTFEPVINNATVSAIEVLDESI
jgi:malectin (di-glucose binding ER protein)